MTEHPFKGSEIISALGSFMNSAAGGGALLILASALAIFVANSPMATLYHDVLHQPWIWSPVAKLNSWHLWINDGLMALFFFLVGLEIKREFVDGRLSTWEKRRLPVIAAAAGMGVPALVYLVTTTSYPEVGNGWAIPAATDIAFALGVLSLLGRRVPTSLKLFLVTVAIVDDMGAVTIIALAYTPALSTQWLLAAAAVLLAMHVLNRNRMMRTWPYLLLAAILWYCVLQSGVHATIAGVLAAMMIPIIPTPGEPDDIDSPLHRLEHALHPWSAFLIIPLFGFANAGVAVGDVTLETLLSPVPLGVALGLFLGKQIGIFAAIWLSVKTGFAGRLRGASWLQIYGVAMLCGIGFTMSLFIGELAFPGQSDAAAMLREEAKIGILAGSLLSAVLGYAVLRLAPLHPDHDRIEAEERREIESDGDIASVTEAAGTAPETLASA